MQRASINRDEILWKHDFARVQLYTIMKFYFSLRSRCSAHRKRQAAWHSDLVPFPPSRYEIKMPAVRFDCTVTTFSIQIPIKKLFIKIARLPLQATLLSTPAERYNVIDNLFFRKARVYTYPFIVRTP